MTTEKIAKQTKEKLKSDILACEREEFVIDVQTRTKGRGVVACKEFTKGDFVVEYRGELVNLQEARRRKCLYDIDPDRYGSFVYDIKFRGVPCSIDATVKTQFLGRIVNHSINAWNCLPKVYDIDDAPRLILVAAKTISKGDEILYNYADRNKDNIGANKWLKKSA